MRSSREVGVPDCQCCLSHYLYGLAMLLFYPSRGGRGSFTYPWWFLPALAAASEGEWEKAAWDLLNVAGRWVDAGVGVYLPTVSARVEVLLHRLNMELDLQSLFGPHVYSCTHWLRPRTLPPSPRSWAHIRGRYWSDKIDDISLWPPALYSSPVRTCPMPITPPWHSLCPYFLARILVVFWLQFVQFLYVKMLCSISITKISAVWSIVTCWNCIGEVSSD
jgi:hypothetical protein